MYIRADPQLRFDFDLAPVFLHRIAHTARGRVDARFLILFPSSIKLNYVYLPLCSLPVSSLLSIDQLDTLPTVTVDQ